MVSSNVGDRWRRSKVRVSGCRELQISCLHQKRSQSLSALLCFLDCKYIFPSTDRMLLTVLFTTLSKCGCFMIDDSDHLYLPKGHGNCRHPLLLQFIVYKCFSFSHSGLKKSLYNKINVNTIQGILCLWETVEPSNNGSCLSMDLTSLKYSLHVRATAMFLSEPYQVVWISVLPSINGMYLENHENFSPHKNMKAAVAVLILWG